MADSLAPETLTKDTWIDIYAATGIAKTSGLVIQNIKEVAVEYAILLAEPTTELAGTTFHKGDFIQVDANVSGFWMKAVGAEGLVTVQEDV